METIEYGARRDSTRPQSIAMRGKWDPSLLNTTKHHSHNTHMKQRQ
jgi:hypothetical protein